MLVKQTEQSVKVLRAHATCCAVHTHLVTSQRVEAGPTGAELPSAKKSLLLST